MQTPDRKSASSTIAGRQMTMGKKKIVGGMLIFLVAAVTTAAYIYFSIVIPQQRLNDPEWVKTASEAELRHMCHKVISFRLSDPHDAFIYLIRIGNAESVPLLIRALGWQDGGEQGLVPCTIGHCVEALRNVTGQDFGTSHRAWRQWWEEVGSRLPHTEFFPRSISGGASSLDVAWNCATSREFDKGIFEPMKMSADRFHAGSRS